MDDELISWAKEFTKPQKPQGGGISSSKASALQKAADDLGVDAADLGSIISFESAGSFNPHKVGGEGNKYKGLIQFGPAEQQKYYKPNDTFESQVQDGVVRFFRDRYKQVGKDTRGATLEDLYTTVIAGNPKANRDAKDSFGTSARSGAQRILKEHRPKVIKDLFGGIDTYIPDDELWGKVDSALQTDEDIWGAVDQALEPRVQPTKELDATIQGQIQSANDPNVKTRFGVLATEPEQATLFANQPNFKPFETKEGTLWLNTAKIFANKKLKLKNEKDLIQYVAKNPQALTTLIGIDPQNDVGNATQGTALRAKDPKTGIELATTVVNTPVGALAQAQNYKDQFPNAEIEVTDTDVVTDERKQGEEIDRLAPTSLTGEADDVAPVYPAQPTTTLPVAKPKQAVIAPKGQPKAVPPIKTTVSGKPSEMPVLTEQDYQDYFKAYPDILDTPANRIAAAELHRIGKWNTEAQRKRLGESDEPVILDEPEVQRVSAKDADNAIADTFDVNGMSIEDATKKVRSQLSAKYDKDFSKLVLTDTQGNPLTDPAQLKKPIALTYGKLKTYGVDTEPLVTQRVAETRIEDPEPNLDVKSDFSAEDAESLNNTFGTTIGSAIASTLNAGGNTANSLAGLLKIIQDLNPAKLDSMAEASKLKPYRAGEDVVKYLQGVGASTGALTAKTGDKYYEPATTDDKGYLEGRPVEKETWATTGGKAVGALADMPRIALMPGGLAAPMLSFATDAMLQAASQGEEVDWSKVKKAGTHGAVLGGIAQVAPFVGKAGNTAISTLLNKASSNVLKEGITLGTIGGGTYVASREMGASRDAAFREAVLFSAMHGFGVLKKMVGEPIRVKDTNGNEAVIKISEDGKVETLDPKTEAKAQMVIPKEVETEVKKYSDEQLVSKAIASDRSLDIKDISKMTGLTFDEVETAVANLQRTAKNRSTYANKDSAIKDQVKTSELKGNVKVPETGLEPEKVYTSALDEIRQKGADTKAKIKEIFPQLSNEEAADLRRQAFPENVSPKAKNIDTKQPSVDSVNIVAKPVENKVEKPVVATGVDKLSPKLTDAEKAELTAKPTMQFDPLKAADDHLNKVWNDPTITPEKAAEDILKTYESTNTPNTNVEPAKTTEVKTDSNVRSEGKTESKVDEIRPQGTGTTDSVQPTEGTKPSKIGVSIERKAIEKGLTDTFEGTAGYEPTTVKEQAKMIADVLTNPERVQRIIEGKEAVPNGLRQSYFIKGVEDAAIARGDVETIKALAKSKLTSDTSTFAQEMRMMGERSQDSVTARINELRAERREAFKNKGHDVRVLDTRIKELEAKLAERESDVAKMQTRSELSKATVEQNITRPLIDRAERYAERLRKEADVARERLKKRGNVFQSGIDPIAMKELAKIGASHIADLGLDFAKFSDKMVGEFGKKIKPHLKDLYEKAQEIATKFDRRALKMIESRLATQIANLERQIETKTRDVVVREPIPLSEKGKELQAKRDALRKELDEIVPKERQSRTVEQKQDAYKKNLERQIAELDKQIEAKSKPVSVKTPTTPEIDALKKKRDDLTAKRDEAIGKPPKPTPEEAKINARAKALEKQIDDLNKEIVNKQRMVKAKPRKVVSDRITELEKKRDAIKEQRDKLLPKKSKPMSVEMKQSLYVKNLQKQIDALNKQIETGVKPAKGKPLPTNPLIDKLKMQRDALKAKLPAVDKAIADAQYNKTRKTALEKQIATLDAEIKSGIKQTKEKMVRKLSPEVEKLAQKRDELKEQHTEVFGKPEMSDAKRLQLVKQRSEKTIAILKGEAEAPPRRAPVTLDAQAENLKAQINLLRSKVDVSDAEIETLAGLTKTLADARQAMQGNRRAENATSGTPEELAYGRAEKDFHDYLNDLKHDAKATKWEDVKVRPLKATARWAAATVVNAPGVMKSMKATLDDSALFRQGWKTLFTNPIIWKRNALKSFSNIARTLRGKEVEKEIFADIVSRPTYDLMKKAGLDVGVREEAFPSQLPEKIPGFRRLYKASETAYMGFLHKTRADIFDKMIRIAKDQEVKLTDTELTNIGRMVNSLTGRGYLGKLELAADPINTIFFSPRMLKGQIDTLLQPMLGGTSVRELTKGENYGSKFVRKQAAYNLFKSTAGTAAVIAIAKMIAPGSVTLDPRSSDFGKVKVGNTRFDVTGGLGSILTLMSRLITSQSVSTATGAVSDLQNPKFGGKSHWDIIEDFFENKLSPMMGIVRDFAKGKNFEGEKPTLIGAGLDSITPLPIHTFVELLKDPKAQKDPRFIVFAQAMDMLGISTNTYSGTRPPKNKTDMDDTIKFLTESYDWLLQNPPKDPNKK